MLILLDLTPIQQYQAQLKRRVVLTVYSGSASTNPFIALNVTCNFLSGNRGELSGTKNETPPRTSTRCRSSNCLATLSYYYRVKSILTFLSQYSCVLYNMVYVVYSRNKV